MTAATHDTSHTVTIVIDNEQLPGVPQHTTPNEILRLDGIDPATHYLERIEGRHLESFQGEGDRQITRPRPGALRVPVHRTGCRPRDHRPAAVGPAALHAGLLAAGYTPQQIIHNGAEFVVFDYTIEVGPRAGTVVRVGLQVPPDFPTTPPGGPQVTPRLGHPHGAVHASPLGGGWEYWSRPAANWAADRSVRGYLRHLRTLFAQLAP